MRNNVKQKVQSCKREVGKTLNYRHVNKIQKGVLKVNKSSRKAKMRNEVKQTV